jgi:hypothetical protein
LLPSFTNKHKSLIRGEKNEKKRNKEEVKDVGFVLKYTLILQFKFQQYFIAKTLAPKVAN